MGFPAHGVPTLATLNLTCSDFKRNQDGTWSARHPLQIGPSRVSPDVPLKPGGTYGGIDLAGTVDKECGKADGKR
ncbi:MAG TPA: hypothetical protein VMF03_18305 [Steroidobacteraceae bacterium]|nr:hypothetical protein [Steroidobacteraceae bacterium]